MPSKKKTIDYSNISNIPSQVKGGFSFIDYPDCFLERLAISAFESANFKKVFGPELTVDWMEENIFSPGLFGAEGPFLVLEADKLSATVKSYLIDRDLPQDEVVVFSTNKKFSEKKLLSKYSEVKVSGPKFWEMTKYLQFLAESLELRLDMPIIRYLEDTLEPTTESYFVALSMLKTYANHQRLELNQVKQLLRPVHLDNFELADFLNAKNLKRFFLSLLKIENDFNIYRNFFIFIQGHVAKILDPSYASSKAKLSKYDQGIIQASKKWSKPELVALMEQMTEFEILSKEKNMWLRDRLRLEYLRNF